MEVLNIRGIDLEIYEHPSGFWHDNKIIFYSDPEDKKQDVIQYLYNEGFIQDRRTPYIIKDLS
jgi:kynureninase